MFLSGAKTCYRAYSSSKVVEMELMPKAQCESRIGRLTGIEAYTLVNTWQPEAYGINALPGREGWEGFYLLRYTGIVFTFYFIFLFLLIFRAIPRPDLTYASGKYIRPAAFVEDSCKDLKKKVIIYYP